MGRTARGLRILALGAAVLGCGCQAVAPFHSAPADGARELSSVDGSVDRPGDHRAGDQGGDALGDLAGDHGGETLADLAVDVPGDLAEDQGGDGSPDDLMGDGVPDAAAESVEPQVIIEDPQDGDEVMETFLLDVRCHNLAGPEAVLDVLVDGQLVATGDCAMTGFVQLQIVLEGDEGARAIEVKSQVDPGAADAVAVTKRYCAPKGIPGPLFSAGSGTSDDPYKVCTLAELQRIGEGSDHLDQHFEQHADIDASPTSAWIALEPGITGFRSIGGRFIPVGTYEAFSGSYDGKGYSITALHTSVGPAEANARRTGLFGVIGAAGLVQNVRLVDVDVQGGRPAACFGNGRHGGALAAVNEGTVVACSVVGGSVSGHYPVGGLIGTSTGDVSNCMAEVAVEGKCNVGGLIGQFQGDSTLARSYAVGPVTALDWEAGGLVGHLGVTGQTGQHGTIVDCFTVLAGIAAPSHAGGIVGHKEQTGTIHNTYTSWPDCVGWDADPGATDCDPSTPLSHFEDPANEPMVGWSTSVWNLVLGALPTLL